MEVIGYGICGPKEKRLKQTLQEFKRLTDRTIILTNNASNEDKKLIRHFGFAQTEDNREWGKYQWQIKERFVKSYVAPRAKRGDWFVCLDMDEVFEPSFTRDKLLELSDYSALYFYLVNLVDDGYAPDISFWNIRAWRNVGDYEWERKPLHCGLAPKWAYHYANYAPYLVEHYGLKDKADRDKKIERYKKYDPKTQYILRKDFYEHLKETRVLPYNQDKLHAEVVENLKQKQKPKMPKQNTSKEWTFIRRLYDGFEFEVPSNKVEDYLKQSVGGKGFEVVGTSTIEKSNVPEAPVKKRDEDSVPSKSRKQK